MLSIAPVPLNGHRSLMVSMASNTHVALSLPPGRYESFDWRTKPIEFDVGNIPLAYRLSNSVDGGPRFTIVSINAAEAAQDAQATTNLLVPGAKEDPRRTEELEWSDIRPDAAPDSLARR